MASVFRPKGKKTFTVTWFDSSGKRKYVRGLASKTLAVQIGEKREFAKQAAQHGIITHDAERHAHEADRTLEEHLSDFESHLKAKKNTGQHVYETVSLVRRVFKGAGIERLNQIERNKVYRAASNLEPRRKVEGGKLSNRTLGKALAACKEFTAWLTPARIPSDPLYRIKGWNPEETRKRRRKILAEDQIVRLIETTADQPKRGGMTGIDRMMRYAIGIGTGFRQKTLFSLTPESFYLDGAEPFIRAEATNVKNRKQVDQPIRKDLADIIRPWLASKPAKKTVFPKQKWASSINAYRHDLKAAGIEYHEPETVFYTDLHAHRNTFITAVIRAAGLKVAQDLAQHSTPNLTSKYGQMDMRDYAKGLDGLPKLKAPKQERKQKSG